MNLVVGLISPAGFVLLGLRSVWRKETAFGLRIVSGGLALAYIAFRAFQAN
jgi:hypothetical protein